MKKIMMLPVLLLSFLILSCNFVPVNYLYGTWEMDFLGTSYYRFYDDRRFILQHNYYDTTASFSEGTYILNGDILDLTIGNTTTSYQVKIDGKIMKLTTVSGLSITLNLLKQEDDDSLFYRYIYEFINQTNDSIVINPSIDAEWSSFLINPNDTYELILWKSYIWYFSYPQEYNCDVSNPGKIIITKK